MSATVKRTYPGGVGLTWHDDDTAEVDEFFTVTNIPAQTSESGLLLAAIDAVDQAYPAAPALDPNLRCTLKTAQPLSDSQATVRRHWAINDSPLLDGPWICEVASDSVREMRGVDYAYAPLTIEYVNHAMLLKPDTGELTKTQFLSVWGNMRRFKRGFTLPGFYNRPRVSARRQISANKADGMSVHPRKWAAKYVDYANTEIPVYYTGGITVPAGVFRCASIRVYSRNRGASWFVDAEFILDKQGHEGMELFVDSDGLVPADIEPPAEMILPWPTTRTQAAGTEGNPVGGCARPQMLRGIRSFADRPLAINLEPFYAV